MAIDARKSVGTCADAGALSTSTDKVVMWRTGFGVVLSALSDFAAKLWASPALTGTPTAPTAALGTNTTQIATMAALKAATDALLNGAPGALDTLKELADALGDDANYAATITAALALKAPLANPTLTGSVNIPTQSGSDNSTLAASTAMVQAALAAAGISTTGRVRPMLDDTPSGGWILWADGTIGNAASSASLRANSDTSALSTMIFNKYSDAICPILTSAGGATTRAAQGSAAAAFAAGCRFTLPRGPGHLVGVAGAGAGFTSRALGVSVGSETETQTLAKLVPHTHNVTAFNNSANDSAVNGSIYTQSSITSTSAGGGDPLSIMPPSTFINWEIKL